MIIRAFFAAALCALAAPALAAPPVAIDSAVFVERTSDDSRSLTPAQRLSRGDRVVYVTSWRRIGGGGFVLTTPLPRDVAYQGSADANEEVSADGGRSWGRLGTLRIGARMALAEDVTHVRWHVVPALAAKGAGRIAWSAIVR
ncbi:MAG: hypothetical protein ACREBO_12375 [Novosphingobium sp.]